MIALFKLREAQLGARIGRFSAERLDDLGNITVYSGSNITLPDSSVVSNNTDFSPISPLQFLSLDLSPRESRLNAQLSIPLYKDSGALRPAIRFKDGADVILVQASNLPVMDTLDQVLFEVESAADSVGVGDATAVLSEPEPFVVPMPPSMTTISDQTALQTYRPIVAATIDLVTQIKTVTLQIPVGVAGAATPEIQSLLDFDDGQE